MRVLALVPGDIGNQLLFFPTLETISQRYPQAAIDVLVEPRSKKAYRVCKNVDDVLVFDFQDRNSFADYLNLLGIVRDREYDVLVSLKTSWRIKLLLWLNGIPTRVGYQDDTALYLSNTVALNKEQYTAETYHDLVKGLGIKASCPPITINVPKEDISWAEYEQQRLGISDSGYIALCDEPESVGGSDAYSLPSWKKIADDIEQRQTGLSIVLIQTDNNQDWVSAMVSANNSIKVLAPGDMGKKAAVIAGANLMLCNNSAPAQLAVATGTYSFILSTKQNHQFIPPENKSCTLILSETNTLKDIPAETIIQQIWQT